jgi:hypothetical protein
VQITDANQLLDLGENEFVGELPKMTNSQINFTGKNNILICEEGVHLWNSRIDFNLDNSVLYLSQSCYDYSVNIPFTRTTPALSERTISSTAGPLSSCPRLKTSFWATTASSHTMWFSGPPTATAFTMQTKRTASTMQEASMSATMCGSARTQWFSRDQK